MSLTFGQPWLLLGLVLPLALLMWVWTRRGGRVALPFDSQVSGGSRGRWLRFFLQLSESLPALLLGVAIVILAGPEALGVPKSKRKLTNIQICLDVSGSMTSEMGDRSRYRVAMGAIGDFLEYRKGDAFGLTFFGNNVLHWVPLTEDASAFRCALPFMDPAGDLRPPGFGGTAIGKAVRACLDVLRTREEGDRMIILVSDGQSGDLGGGQDLAIAQTLRDERVSLYGIHIAEGDVPGGVVNLASISGGDVFTAGDPAGLEAVFRRIDEMEKPEVEKIAGELIDDFVPWCWAGLGILAAFGLLQFFLRATPW